jgi:hypothetical protein
MSSIPNFFSINGVIDTSRSVLENMNAICEASGCWLTFDIHEGRWAVVINNIGTSVASFDDSNIIGGIDITSTSLTEVYNSVTYEFPHQDLRSERDSVTMKIPNADRYPNEPDNELTISSELVNNQAQAQALAARQLKQSRVDKVLSFTADYSYVNLKAGDLIDVSAKSYFDYDYYYPSNYYANTDAAGYYGLINKKFRIINISEQDGDDGTLTMKITALEYNADVYSTSGLVITERNQQNGITAKTLNSTLTTIDDQSLVNKVNNGMANSTPSQNTALVNNLISKGFVNLIDSQVLPSIILDYDRSPSSSSEEFFNPDDINDAERYWTTQTVTLPYTGKYLLKEFYNWGVVVDIPEGQKVGDFSVIPATIRKQVRMYIKRNGTPEELGGGTRIGRGEDPWADLNLNQTIMGIKGEIIQVGFVAKHDMPNAVGSPFIILTSDIYYIGPN